jgi:hypothetical protein
LAVVFRQAQGEDHADDEAYRRNRHHHGREPPGAQCEGGHASNFRGGDLGAPVP